MNDPLSVWDSIGTPRILVVGDIILDQYTWGSAERVSPEAPVLILNVDHHEVRLGGAASVACLLCGLDAQVTLAGVVGDDNSGRLLLRLLDDSNIDRSLILCDESRPTTTKTRYIGRAEGKQPHHVLRVDEEMCEILSAHPKQSLTEAICDRLQEFDVILISDYAKGVCRSGVTTFQGAAKSCAMPSGVGFQPAVSEWHTGSLPHEKLVSRTDEFYLVRRLIEAANDHRMPVLVDPARLPEYDCYHGATLLKPNRVEAQLATNLQIETEEDATHAAEFLTRTLSLHAAVVTLGCDGMVLAQQGRQTQSFPTARREVCDITGAGDAALATLGLVLAAHKSKVGVGDSSSSVLRSAVQLANIASGLQVEQIGVTPIHRAEVRAELVNRDQDHPVQHPKPLRPALTESRNT